MVPIACLYTKSFQLESKDYRDLGVVRITLWSALEYCRQSNKEPRQRGDELGREEAVTSVRLVYACMVSS